MKLYEVSSEKKKGTYAAVKFCKKTKDALKELAEKFDIPKPLGTSKFHTTLIYSEKYLPELRSLGKLDEPFSGTPIKCESWGTQEGTNALVLTFKSPDLVKRHKSLMKEHDATWSHPTYKPHVTLSYDCGDFDMKDINKYLQNAPFYLSMVKEYHEDLNLDWANDNG